MARELRRMPLRLIDQQTYLNHESERLTREEVTFGSTYLLRHRCLPNKEYYAFESRVKVVDIVHSEFYKKVLFRVLGTDPDNAQSIPAWLNVNNYLAERHHYDKKTRHRPRGHLDAEVGYLLGDASMDQFIQDWKAYATTLELEQKTDLLEAI